jgi:hypothetical protein
VVIEEAGVPALLWREEIEIEGKPMAFELGVAIPREQTSETVISSIQALLETAWQTKEFVRLGCYRLRPKDEVNP